MLQPSTAMEGLFQSFDAIRKRVDAQVAKIAAELEKPSRRNVDTIVSSSALIDGALRDYRMYMVQVNQVRIQEEAQATSHDELMVKRREWGAVTSRTNLFQGELNRWHEIKQLVDAQRRVRRKKLYAVEDKLPPTTLAQMRASDDIFKWLHAAINPVPQSEHGRESGSFPDIGLPNSDFHAHLHAAYRVCLAQKRSGPIRFLDVGCGAGLKLFSASRYFDEVYGIDLDPGYLEAANRFFAMSPGMTCRIAEQDALTFDRYGDFDVIYFYRPISDEAKLIALEQRIAEMAQEGTILVAPYITFPTRHAEIDCGRVDGAVYLAKTSQRAADAVRRKAETIGEYVLEPKPKAPKTIWDPLIDASRANGFDFLRLHRKARH